MNDYDHETMTWKDGRKYTGTFQNGLPHGKGTMTWKDGRKYIGIFQNGLPHGEGTMIWADDRQHTGYSQTNPAIGIHGKSRSQESTLSINGNSCKRKNASELMVTIFRYFAKKYPSFLENFYIETSATGKKRSYIGRDKEELYPDRPDLQKKFSKKIIDDWWMGTNYSNEEKKKMIKIAFKVAGIKWGSDIKIELGKVA